MHIGYANQNPTSHYWLIVSHGVRQRAAELGIDVTTKHADTLEQQIAAINTFIEQRVDVLLLGPIAAHGLAQSIAQAHTARIPVIVLAAELSDCTVTCTVRSDHMKGGELAASYVVERLGGHGEVAHIMGPSRLQDNIDRAMGVRRIFGQHPGIQIVFEKESPDWFPHSGAALMREALQSFPNLRGVCVASDPIALGAITEIKAAGQTGQIVVTGFDATPDALIAIHEGSMSATIRQSIRGIGQTAVEMAQRLMDGEVVPSLVFTDIALVTQDNVLEVTLESLDLLPRIMRDQIEGHEQRKRLQDQMIATQRQLLDELSARQQVEEAIRFQARLLDAVEEAVIAVDCGGKIIYWNRFAELMYGWTTMDALGRHLDLVLASSDRRNIGGLTSHVKLGKRWSGEAQAQRRDGTEFPILITQSPIFEQDRLIGGVSVSIDITDRKRAEDERFKFERKLLEMQKLESLGVLTGGIAHDFNNLLMTILGNVGLALLDLDPESPAWTSLSEIEQAAKHAADLTHQMLAYAGKGPLNVQPLQLNAVIEGMTELLKVSAPKSVELEYNLALHLPLIEADATQLRQIVMNLATNAAEAIGNKAGRIVITTGVQFADDCYLSETDTTTDLPEGQYVFLQVCDTGSGIDSVTQRKMFEPFFTTKFQGRGLGLAAVRGIVHTYNGAVRVSSKPGHGTTLTLLFPVAAPN